MSVKCPPPVGIRIVRIRVIVGIVRIRIVGIRIVGIVGGGAGRGWPALSEAQDRAAILRRDPHCESRYPAARSVSRRYPAAALSRSRRYPAATRTKEPRYPAGRRKGECAAILRRTPPAEPLSCGGATRAAILRPEDCPCGGQSAALGVVESAAQSAAFAVRFAALGAERRGGFAAPRTRRRRAGFGAESLGLSHHLSPPPTGGGRNDRREGGERGRDGDQRAERSPQGGAARREPQASPESRRYPAADRRGKRRAENNHRPPPGAGGGEPPPLSCGEGRRRRGAAAGGRGIGRAAILRRATRYPARR